MGTGPSPRPNGKMVDDKSTVWLLGRDNMAMHAWSVDHQRFTGVIKNDGTGLRGQGLVYHNGYLYAAGIHPHTLLGKYPSADYSKGTIYRCDPCGDTGCRVELEYAAADLKLDVTDPNDPALIVPSAQTKAEMKFARNPNGPPNWITEILNDTRQVIRHKITTVPNPCQTSGASSGASGKKVPTLGGAPAQGAAASATLTMALIPAVFAMAYKLA